MEIKYAGPKVVFSKHGIDFDNNKDDKYIYLNIAVQLAKAFDHDYLPDEKYIYDMASKRLSDSEILSFVIKSFPNHNELLKQAQKDAENFFVDEMEKVNHQKAMISESEYNSWVKNIELMKDYVIQRRFNKVIYYAIIEKIAKSLKTQGVVQIHAPMYQNFVHVFHSLKGPLKEKPEPKESKIEIYEENGKLMANLNII